MSDELKLDEGLEAELRGAAPSAEPIRGISTEDVRLELRRRRNRRGAVGIAAMACVATLFALRMPKADHHPVQGATAQPELHATISQTDDSAAPVEALFAEVTSYTSNDVVENDRAYDAFGPLAGWTAPPETNADNLFTFTQTENAQ